MENQSAVPTLCSTIENFLLDPLDLVMLNTHLILQFLCLVAIGILFQQFYRYGFPVHGNLLVKIETHKLFLILQLLFGNIVICTFFTDLCFFLIKLRHKASDSLPFLAITCPKTNIIGPSQIPLGSTLLGLFNDTKFGLNLGIS